MLQGLYRTNISMMSLSFFGLSSYSLFAPDRQLATVRDFRRHLSHGVHERSIHPNRPCQK